MNQPINILIIDDEYVIRLGCKQTLEQSGMHVDFAESGLIGLAKVQDKHYDVVLIDIKMPQICGFNILESIRKMDKNIITIVITGYATEELALEAMEKGAFAYLFKPFTPDELRQIVNQGLEERKKILDASKNV